MADGANAAKAKPKLKVPNNCVTFNQTNHNGINPLKYLFNTLV